MAVFPFLEANQGALSLLALVAALGVAVYEHVRAESATKDRVRSARTLSVDLLNSLVESAQQEVAVVEASDEGDRAADERLNAMARRSSAALDGIRLSAPPSAHLMLALLKAKEVSGELNIIWLPGISGPVAARGIKRWIDRVTACRDELQALEL